MRSRAGAVRRLSAFRLICRGNEMSSVAQEAGRGMRRDDVIWTIVITVMAVTINPVLKSIGLLPADRQINQTDWLLNEALDQAVVFIPFSAGTMTFWEHDLYEKNLAPEQFNQRWWEYAARFQGIEPPSPRGEEYCDACTKTHINDDPAQYYDYAIAYVIKYQLHNYIAKNI